MKRIWLGLVLAICLLPSVVSAAWTVDSSLCSKHGYGGVQYVTIAVVSDGAAQSTALDLMALIPASLRAYFTASRWVYGVYTEPDATNPPIAQYTMSLTDRMNSTLSLANQGVSAKNTPVYGALTDTSMYFVLANYLTMTCTDAGDSGDTILITFMIL